METTGEIEGGVGGVGPGRVAVGYQDGVAVVSLVGEHDLSTARELEAAIAAQAQRGCGVVVSVEETDFLDSSVIRTLFAADRSLRLHGRTLVLHVGTAKIVERTLELSGALEGLPWSDSMAESVRLAQQTD